MSTGTRTLRLGTRRSALARAQSGWLAERLGRPVELVDVTTTGDVSAAAIAELGGTGVFVSALRERLLAGEVDLVVHSLKDLPTADPAGLTLAAVPTRADPRDVLVTAPPRPLAALPAGARLGTGSPRRTAQLLALRRGLAVVPVRGNVDTRLARVGDDLDGVVLAACGLDRLGRSGEAVEVLDPAVMLPAAGQGALAVECRSADADLIAHLAGLDDPASRAATAAERAVLAGLGAGCTAPVGALAEVAAGELRLRAAVFAPDGATAVRLSVTGPAAEAQSLGHRLAADLVRSGAADLLGDRQ